MDTKYKFIVPVALVALLAAGCSSSTNSSYSTDTGTPPVSSPLDTPVSSPPPAAATSTKFSDQLYYPNSYLISGATLSADAQTALAGFKMTKTAGAGGTTEITLTAIQAGYKNQQYTLQPGQQLYFIEKFLGDDKSGSNEDSTPADDMAVVVDSQGNVVGQPASWTTSQ